MAQGGPQPPGADLGPDNIFTPADISRRLAGTDRVLDQMLYGFAIRHDKAIERATCSASG